MHKCQCHAQSLLLPAMSYLSSIDVFLGEEGGAVVKVWSVLEMRVLCHNYELGGKLNGFGNSEFSLIPLMPRKYDGWWRQSRTDAIDRR